MPCLWTNMLQNNSMCYLQANIAKQVQKAVLYYYRWKAPLWFCYGCIDPWICSATQRSCRSAKVWINCDGKAAVTLWEGISRVSTAWVYASDLNSQTVCKKEENLDLKSIIPPYAGRGGCWFGEKGEGAPHCLIQPKVCSPAHPEQHGLQLNAISQTLNRTVAPTEELQKGNAFQ